MKLLKEDGSLDIERINKLPYEEYMDAMGSLTQEQVEEYISALPTDESKEPVKPVMTDETMEEFMARTGAVDIDEYLARMKKRLGNFNLEGWTPTPVEQALYDGTFEQMLNESEELDNEEIPSDFLEVQDFDDAMEDIKREIDEYEV